MGLVARKGLYFFYGENVDSDFQVSSVICEQTFTMFCSNIAECASITVWLYRCVFMNRCSLIISWLKLDLLASIHRWKPLVVNCMKLRTSWVLVVQSLNKGCWNLSRHLFGLKSSLTRCAVEFSWFPVVLCLLLWYYWSGDGNDIRPVKTLLQQLPKILRGCACWVVVHSAH